MFGALQFNTDQLHAGVTKLTSPYADNAAPSLYHETTPGEPAPLVAPPSTPVASPNHWVAWAIGGLVVGGGLYLLLRD